MKWQRDILSLPYSERCIFVDTEFTSMDIRVGELLSVGLVRPNGEELYVEIEYTGSVHPWVQEHVLPYLQGNPVSSSNAVEQLRTFVGNDTPYMISYVNQFDAVYWYTLFGSPQAHPCYWIPIDFASILFAHGFDPNSMGKHAFFEQIGVQKDTTVQKHHALHDARWLKTVYTAFFTYLQKQRGIQ